MSNGAQCAWWLYQNNADNVEELSVVPEEWAKLEVIK
jgi:hypothetical protein